MRETVLEGIGLSKHFYVGSPFSGGKRRVRAVESVDIAIRRGETVGLVGESGCGKSTIGRLLLRLLDPTEGRIRLLNEDVTGVSGAKLRRLRQRMQIVFQDPFASLNPRHRVGDILSAPFRIHGTAPPSEISFRVADLMGRVGLDPAARHKFPHEFSGGQRQRIGIARALALEPDVIVCDEPVSALDVSVQAQIVNLLRDLTQQTGIALLFISHDLAVVENICDRVAVMYLGRIVEFADRDQLFDAPRHPYTKALLQAVPRPDPNQRNRDYSRLEGEVPSPINPPAGCAFHTRCPVAMGRCKAERPILSDRGESRMVACHLN
ncbi:MAG: ATP-binding cassette domain-containing protein [Albidovulum sp.]|nr:ATP-binding cassette domain-containing protein [Albidovulum sp.]